MCLAQGHNAVTPVKLTLFSYTCRSLCHTLLLHPPKKFTHSLTLNLIFFLTGEQMFEVLSREMLQVVPLSLARGKSNDFFSFIKHDQSDFARKNF